MRKDSPKYIIEIDGPIHIKQTEYDNDRENEIMLREISVIRFSNDEVESDIDMVLNRINQKIIEILKNKANTIKSP